MRESYEINTLGRLATLAVAESAAIGMYAGYALCKAINKHKLAKAAKAKQKNN